MDKSTVIRDKRVVLGDIHGCREYLDALLANGEFENIGGLLATGDIGGYGPDSLYCYQFLIDLKKKLESEGKIFRVVRGNHEDALELRLTHPEVGVSGISKTADIGVLLAIEQMFGKGVCKEKTKGEKVLDSKVVRRILLEDWNQRLKAGNLNIVNPDYLNEIKTKCVDNPAKYAGQLDLLKNLPNVLSFIVNLPKEERIGRVKIRHTADINGKTDAYVMGKEQLAYANRVMEASKKSKMDRKRYLTDDEVFDSDLFQDCDVLILGHVHSSDNYIRGNKRIIMANSPFPRDGLGIRAPVLIYQGGLIRRKDLEYNFEETKRKLKDINPRFLEQIELYRRVPRNG